MEITKMLFSVVTSAVNHRVRDIEESIQLYDWKYSLV